MVTFRIEDMTCGHCASTIARAVAEVDRDARIEVSIRDKLVRIRGTAAEADLDEAIREAGYTPRKVLQEIAPMPAAAGGCCCGPRKAAGSAQAKPDAGGGCCR